MEQSVTQEAIDVAQSSAHGFLSGGWMASIVIAVFFSLLIVVILRWAAKYYRKVPPNMMAVFSGRKHKLADGTVVGYEVVIGGAKFLWPFFERYDEMSLDVVMIPDISVKNGLTKNGVPVNVKAVATVKIGSEPGTRDNAIERLLGKQPAEIKEIAHENLKTHLRAILGTLTVEEIAQDRKTFSSKTAEEAKEDLAKIGLTLDMFNIEEVEDDNGYLKSLGMKKIAEVKKAGDIGKAEAERESTKATTTAQQEGETTKQQNLAMIAEAEKNLKVKKAEYDAEVRAQEATASQAGPLAEAEARKAVVEKETEVAKLVAMKKEQELITEKEKPALAQKNADVLAAEGKAKAMEIEAEALKKKKIAEGEGDAAAIEARKIAEANGVKAMLLAEAEGIEKKADAFKRLDESGRLLQVLEAVERILPQSIEKFAGVMHATAQPLGNIDKLVVIDGGGGSGTGGSGLERFASTVPNLLLKTMEQLNAGGINITDVLAKLGVKFDITTLGAAASNGKAAHNGAEVVGAGSEKEEN